MAQVNNTNNELKRTMKSRHLFMIALGGVIGTGLFNGSGFIISQAGPGGSVLAFIAGGLLMYFVMLCLGELAVAMPVSGSFQEYYQSCNWLYNRMVVLVKLGEYDRP